MRIPYPTLEPKDPQPWDFPVAVTSVVFITAVLWAVRAMGVEQINPLSVFVGDRRGRDDSVQPLDREVGRCTT